MQILIAEDDDISRDMLDNTLSLAGFQVLTAHDGEERSKFCAKEIAGS